MKNLKPPKYYTSTLLRFISYDRFLYRFADRQDAHKPEADLVDRVKNCMIYLLCSRPIVSIIPKSFVYKKNNCEFEITYRIKYIEKKCHVSIPIELPESFDGTVDVSGFPHKSIYIYDKNGNLIIDMLISNYIHLFKEITDDVSNHEVLYIGKGTADCAVDRLDGHSTLEKVLSDILRDEPEKELAILIYNFEMKKSSISIPKLGEKAEIRGKKANEHFEKILKYKPGIDEQTKIAEALLINYFATLKYNSHFSKRISISAKIFENIRNVDFDALIVEISNENIGHLKIFSKNIEANYFHTAKLDIRKSEGRITFLEPNNQ